MFRHTAYLIETLTNTHVGSGDTTLGIVDNEIQKDPVTSLPVFHPSSIKGAVRDHMGNFLDTVNFQKKGSKMIKPFTFQAVFGSDAEEALKALKKKDDPQKRRIDDYKKDADKSDLDEDEKEIVKEKLELLRKAPGHGLVKFYEARLLTLPLRSSTRVFHNGLCPSSALDYLGSLEQFQVENGNDMGILKKEIKALQNLFTEAAKELEKHEDSEFIVFGGDDINLPMIEDFENGSPFELKQPELRSLLSKYFSPRGNSNTDDTPGITDTLAVFRDDIFKLICENGLPVIARNSLNENGISDNLFYEEILPRRSVLWFITGTHRLFSPKEEDPFNKGFRAIEDRMLEDNIQMGANASIGYGLTSISRVGG